VLGVNFNRMMFRPECGPNVSVEGRLAVRNSCRLDISLIVKPSDPEDMIYQLATLPADPHTVLLNGWIPARAAKRLFPLTRVGNIAAHFVEQRELRPMRDLRTFLRHSA
jgi:hypothetical protein